jgi:hypothetical protein
MQSGGTEQILDYKSPSTYTLELISNPSYSDAHKFSRFLEPLNRGTHFSIISQRMP